MDRKAGWMDGWQEVRKGKERKEGWMDGRKDGREDG